MNRDTGERGGKKNRPFFTLFSSTGVLSENGMSEE